METAMLSETEWRPKFLVHPFQNFLGLSLFFSEYSIFFQTSYFTKQLKPTDCKGLLFV